MSNKPGLWFRISMRAGRAGPNVWLAGASFLMVLVLALVLFGLFMSARYSCASRWEGTYETQYGVTNGCRVNVNGKWFPEIAVRAFQ